PGPRVSPPLRRADSPPTLTSPPPIPAPPPPAPPAPASATGETRNLPAAVTPPVEREHGWLMSILRALFGGKAHTIRSDLRTMLEARAGGTGFSPKESAMLQNILSPRERRGAHRMGPRARI